MGHVFYVPVLCRGLFVWAQATLWIIRPGLIEVACRPENAVPRLLTSLCLTWLSFASLVGAAEPPHIASAVAAPEWDQRFQRTSGWIGADGNYSIAVAPDRVLWFYSDTLVGRIENGRRVDTKLINNSVGVQTTTSAGPSLEFFHGTNAKGEPAALFVPDDPTHWYWLMGGACVEGRIHLFLWEFEKSTDPGVFGFRNVGVTLAEVENPQAAPTEWKVTRQPVPCIDVSSDRQILFGSSVMPHDGHAYIYGYSATPAVQHSARHMLVARAPLASLRDHSRWEFRTATGWSADFREAASQVSGIATEYSVTSLPASQQFVTISHGDLLSPKITARFADQPWGPWSAPQEVWTCPEPAAKKGYFAYAGKAHPELSSGNELVLTYAVNSFQFGDLFSDPSLYWPRFVKVKLAAHKPE